MSQKFGVVRFDEPRPDSRAWASIDGGKAFLVRGTSELSSDVTWWTNMDFDSFIKSGCAANRRMRKSDYMRITQEQLCEELGLVEAMATSVKITETLSEIFSRVMRTAVEHYNLKLIAPTLAGDIRLAINPSDKLLGFGIDHAAEQAYQTFQTCERNPARRNTRMVMFRKPRVQHALDIMSTPIPGRQWEFLGKDQVSKIGKSPTKIVDWFLKQDRPALVQATVIRSAPAVSSVVAFGGGAKADRNWISHPELLLLSRFCEMSIKTAFLANEYTSVNSRIPMIGIDGGLDTVSISKGLLAENHWVAVASPQPRNLGDKIFTPQMAWLRASDRIHCFTSAMIVHHAGIHVSMYGIGAVGISVPAGNMDQVIEVAAEAGLLPPLTAREDVAIQKDLS